MRTFGSVAAILVLMAIPTFAADMMSQEAPNEWRASKLAGIHIYGPDDKDIGKITDVLMTKDGKADYVVVGIGGFLGIGEKDVAIPFDQVVFSSEPVNVPPSTAAGSTAANGSSAAAANNPGGVPTSAALGTNAPDAMSGQPAVGGAPATDPTMTAVPATTHTHTAYPDHGRINMTVDQLKSAPAFHFAS